MGEIARRHTSGFRTSSGERAMKKRTIGILATSVAVSALCVVTDVSAIAGRGGGGGGGGWHGGGGGYHGFAARGGWAQMGHGWSGHGFSARGMHEHGLASHG